MNSLHLTFLGRPFIQINGRSPQPALSHKAVALLAYLGVTGQMQSRETLAGLLWSELEEEKARRNLRVELSRLKPIVGEFLKIERRAVGLDFSQSIEIDVVQFEQQGRSPAEDVAGLETAVSLYNGDLLTNLDVPGAYLFEEWVLVQRERYRQIVLDALYQLSKQYTDQNEIAKGITAVRQLLTFEPWLESAHRQLMRLLALDGQRAAALAQYDICTQLLMEELGVTPSIETDNLYDQIESDQVQLPSLQSSIPNPQSPVPSPQLPPPFQPPTQIPHFVGRDALRTQIEAQLLEQIDSSPIALVGMGGVGKSTLATQLAHHLREHFVDGVLWADCMATEPRDILESWGQLFGYDFSGLADLKNRAAAVRGILAEKRVLIVLDDVLSVARIRSLLPNSPNCAVIITTRNLDVATAVSAEEILLNELPLNNGIRLLKNLLGEARVEAEKEATIKICTLLQNLPLALEIVGQLLRGRRRRKLTDMAIRLQKIDHRLGLEVADRAVRASFELSWLTLNERQQQIFSYLGVFEGRPFSRAAVANIAKRDEYDTEDVLMELAALSLLKEVDEEHYRQHALLADSAREKLAEAGQEAIAYTAMSTYFQEFSSRHRADYGILKLEWGNLMAGMEIAHRWENWLLVLAYADALTESWFTRARFDDIRRGMGWAKAAALAIKNQEALAEIHLKWGEALVEQKAFEQGEEQLKASFQLYESLHHQSGMAKALQHLTRIEIDKSNYATAGEYLQACEALAEELEDNVALATIFYRKARIKYRQEGADVSEMLELAINMQEASRDSLGQIRSLRLLATVSMKQDSTMLKAINYIHQALDLSQQIQNKGEEASALYALAGIERKLGNLELAHQYATESLNLFEHMGDKQFEGIALNEISLIYRNQGAFEEALLFGQNSVTVLGDTQDQFTLVYALHRLAQIYEQVDDTKKALKQWQQALQISQSIQHPLLITIQDSIDRIHS
ncbi:MAG: NB-ARC domain-containing protein [Chloroflexota bacterium]